jgi:glycosyltransferase involved in cell wall biosynthesis
VKPPDLSVLVASHDRPLRLRWLLNALAEQTLASSRWEVIVCHDSADAETEELLTSHPLAADGVLRHRRFEPGSAAASIKRNAALALAQAPTVVFTDDDCRPPPDWLAAVSAAVAERPGAVIQGPMAPDPDEATMLRAPFPRTVAFAEVPRVWAESCNIAYPTALIRELRGFAEDLHVGEDTDLSLRAQQAGAVFAGDLRMLSYHAVEEGMPWDRIAQAGRWSDLAALLARQPGVRSELYLRVFWKREHALLLLALLGLCLRRRRGPALAAVLPWVLARQDHGGDVRGLLRQFVALPALALSDAAETIVLARASARARTLIL